MTVATRITGNKVMNGTDDPTSGSKTMRAAIAAATQPNAIAMATGELAGTSFV
ncbi:hypothetical protein AB4Y97_11430 [Microvirga sp. 2TAF3]